VSDPQPIPEFSDRQPIRLWRHQDIDCAIYMGTRAPCGYVRLPESSPLRPIAEAADVVHRTEQHDEAFQDWIDAHPPGAFGYQGLDEVLDVHGGLTFGPTASTSGSSTNSGSGSPKAASSASTSRRSSSWGRTSRRSSVSTGTAS
jgi:hypothetical protein